MQHPVHYLCDVCDFVTDKIHEIYCEERREAIPVYEVLGILNEISRFIVGKENEVMEEGRTNDQDRSL